MPSLPGLIQEHGGQPNRPPKYIPIFTGRFWNGIYLNRAPFRDPTNLADAHFYGGGADAMIDGANCEITNKLFVQRRPGLSQFSSATYSTPPNAAFSFELTNGTIQVLVDTGSTPTIALSSVSMISGVAFYTFSTSQPQAANNAYAGLTFSVAGFDNGVNNGTFVCSYSTSSYLILINTAAATDTAAATAVSAGAVYYDLQDGGPAYSLTSVNLISGVAYYIFGTSQAAAIANGFAGKTYTVAGFNTAANNGTFECIGSTTEFLVLANTGAVNDTHAATATESDKILLFSKQPGAGQTCFTAIAGVLYAGDGVDTWKYTPLNPNTPQGSDVSVWAWGSAAPTAGPTILNGAANAESAWAANTIFSTMGLTIDQNSNVQQLVGINANGANTSLTLGTSSNGTPKFNLTTGATTVDGSVTWTSKGEITRWAANTLYASGAPIWDVNTNCIFVCANASATKSGTVQPRFNSTLGTSGARTTETTGLSWSCLGQANGGSTGAPTSVLTWTKNTSFNTYATPATANLNSAIVTPLIPSVGRFWNPFQKYVHGGWNGNGGLVVSPFVFTPTYLLVATSSGTTANTNYNPWAGISSQSAGQITVDATAGAVSGLEWMCLGSSSWQASIEYTAWSGPGLVFSAIKDTNGNMQVCVQDGISGSSHPTWGTLFGSQTAENISGGAVWVCVGAPVTWAASTQWSLPLAGFQPPVGGQPYGGSLVEGLAYWQAVTASGKSGAGAPGWSQTPGNSVSDNTITWQCAAPFVNNSNSWLTGYNYAYSFGSRLANDFYNTNQIPGLPFVYPSGLGLNTGSGTGLITTASPATATPATGSGVNYVSGVGSLDPQIDTIYIWRCADGGGSDNMDYLVEIPAPAPQNGVAQPWTYPDFLPDVPSTVLSVVYPGLDELIPAPIDEANNPPPSNFLPMVVNFQRIWGAQGQAVGFSGGPDILTGNPNECFNPADNFPYLANVNRIVKNSQGLVVNLTDSIEFIAGGPSTASFYDITLAQGIGLSSYNALDVYAGEIYALSSDGQAMIISPSLSIANGGFAIADQIAAMNPATAYVAVQQSGIDNCVMFADGATGWWRLNPYQVPGGSSGPGPVWSPYATITNGCKMVQSVETTPGIRKLLVGSTQPNQPLLYRNLNVFSDNGTAYASCFFTLGNLVLAHPGQLAILKFLEIDFSYGNDAPMQPTVSFLLDEIYSATTTASLVPTNISTLPSFVKMVQPQQDPPSLYGTVRSAQTYTPLRYYFSATASLARCRSLQLRVDFPTGSTLPDACYDFTLFGKLLQEG